MSATGGWVGKILRVDVTRGRVSESSTFDYVPKFLGGRGLGAKICWDEVPPEVGAFDPDARLIFATGPLQGTLAPTSGRFMLLGKAPQTGPVESYCRSGIGGHWAPELKWAGYDALVIHGQAERPVYLSITDGKALLLDASRLWGLDTYQAQQQLWARHGRQARVMTIGRAGEKRSRIACILTDSGDASGQGGFGGVMGSKRLKAIVVSGTGSVPVANPRALTDLTTEIRRRFARKAAGGDPYAPEDKGFKFNIWGGGYGRGGLTLLPGELQDLCRDPASGYRQAPDGCFACPIACRSRVTGPDITPGVALCAQAYMYLESMVHRPEKGYSKVTWQAAKLADLLGINAYDLMAIIPWLGDCLREKVLSEEDTGLSRSEIGSWEFATRLLHMIANREGLGDLLAEGGQRAAAKLGGRAEELSRLYYPRAGKFGGYREHWVYLGGFPTGYAVSYLALAWALDNRDAHVSHGLMSLFWGAAHAIGQTALTAVPEDIAPGLRQTMKRAFGVEEAAQLVTADGKAVEWKWAAPVVKRYQEQAILKDSYVLCDMAFPFLYDSNSADHVGDPSMETRLYEAVTGKEMSEEASYRLGATLCTLERALAVRDGRSRSDDMFHDLYFATRDAGGRSYRREELERAKTEFYTLSGWEPTRGIPLPSTLRRFGLGDVAEELSRRGLAPGDA